MTSFLQRWVETKNSSADIADSGTSPEPIFDCVTFAAKDLCNVPIAFIALLDTKQRLTVVSRVGLNDLQSARIDTLCSPGLARQQDLLFVSDTTQDNRFKHSPLVVDEPNIRFFASKLLVSANGAAIGTLCILDSKPRQLSELEQNTITHLANAAIRLTEYRSPDSQDLSLADQQQSRDDNGKSDLANTLETADLKSTVGELAVGAAVKLNQPLMAILSYTDAAKSVLEYSEFSGHEELSVCIKNIAEESIRAGELVKDLRDSVKTDSNTTSLFDPKNIIRKSIELVASEARKYDINVLVDLDNSLDDSVVISGNEVQFAQVLLNLLRNSISSIANDKPGFSKIILVRAEKIDGCMVCSVHDNGPGLAQPLHETASQQFYKADGPSIRLSICRSVVDALGGNFWQARKPDFSPGTSLFFSFPI